MKTLFEVDTAHAARTGIALSGSVAIAIIASSSQDRLIAFGASTLVTLITIVAIKEPSMRRKE